VFALGSLVYAFELIALVLVLHPARKSCKIKQLLNPQLSDESGMKGSDRSPNLEAAEWILYSLCASPRGRLRRATHDQNE